MKKIFYPMMVIVVTLSLGVAYAGVSGKRLNNGVTDFTGRSYDTLEIGLVAAANSVESENAGGLRTGDIALSNGVTDFSGRNYDNLEIAPAAAVKSVESENAGGLRKGPEAKKASPEGSGTGRHYDTIPMNPALGW